MGKKKPVKCYNCSVICVEVGRAIGYPKIADEIRPNYHGHEYRYLCPDCGKEWIHDTTDKTIYEVPKTAKFHIVLKNGQEIIQAWRPDVLKFLRITDKKKIEVTPKEFTKLVQTRKERR